MPSTFVCMKSFVKRFFLKHHSVLQWIFLVQSDNNFSTEKRDTRYYEKKIFDSPIFLKHWKDAHEVFRHCETWNFRRKTWYPQICKKFFATPNFQKHSREALEIFWHCETKIFRRKMCSFHPQNRSKPETFSKTVGLPYENFRHWETYKFRLKIVICPLVSINFFRYQKVSGKQKGSFTKNFVSVLWDKKKSTKSWCPPPLPMHENFRQKQFSETPNCCPMKFFGTVRQKLSDGKTWHHLSRNKFFDTPNFLKHWRDAHEIFWHCETKNFRGKNVIPLFLSSKNFSKPEIFSKTVGFRHETFRLCET